MISLIENIGIFDAWEFTTKAVSYFVFIITSCGKTVAVDSNHYM
jgi:hypothetical protein